MPRRPQPALILIGFMGAGKSSTGREVASLLGRELLDTDDEVARMSGATIRDIFAVEKEKGFRAREKTAVRAALEVPGRVVAVGGGAVLAAENRTALKQAGFLVYLRATPETLARRLGQTSDRPLLEGGDRLGRIRELMVARGPIYETAADHVIDTDLLTPSETAASIAAWYRERVKAMSGR